MLTANAIDIAYILHLTCQIEGHLKINYTDIPHKFFTDFTVFSFCQVN